MRRRPCTGQDFSAQPAGAHCPESGAQLSAILPCTTIHAILLLACMASSKQRPCRVPCMHQRVAVSAFLSFSLV